MSNRQDALRRRRAARPGWARAEALEPRALLATITVTSDADGGRPGALTLAQAIQISNGTLAVSSLDAGQAGLVSGPLSRPNTIAFALPGAGPFTIRPDGLRITSPVAIDGYTQPGASPNTNGPGLPDNATLRVELSGASGAALDIEADDVTVRGLAINDSHQVVAGRPLGVLPGVGISIGGVRRGVRIEGDFLGTDLTGRVARPNQGAGVEVEADGAPDGSVAVTIGGTDPSSRNVISGQVVNTGARRDEFPLNYGISLAGRGPVLVQGNFIGLDATGTVALGNDDGIVVLPLASANVGGVSSPGAATVGGTTPGARNVLSGNRTGIDATATGGGLVVLGNDIGLDATGAASVGNRGDGVRVSGSLDTIGGAAAGAGNRIGSNGGAGVAVVALFDPVSDQNSGVNAFVHRGTTGERVTVSGNDFLANAGGDLAFRLDEGAAAGNPLYASYQPPALGPALVAPAPTIRSAMTSGAGTAISGQAGGPGLAVELYAGPAGGTGRTYLGSTTSTADGSFAFVAARDLAGQVVTATATRADGTTSAFSAGLATTPPPIPAPPPLLTTTRLALASTGVNLTVLPIAFEGTVATPSGWLASGGIVTLLEDGRPAASGYSAIAVDPSGHFRFDLPPLGAGDHVFTAAYGGTSVFGSSASGAVPVTVYRVGVGVKLAIVPAQPGPGQPLALVVTITGVPSGFDVSGDTVTFAIDAGPQSLRIANVPLDASNRASVLIAAPAGGFTVSASYDGSAAFAPSGSGFFGLNSTRPTPSVALVGPSGLSIAGQALGFSAVVTPATGIAPTGLVVFAEAGVVLAAVPVDASGTARFATSSLAPGPHVIQAAYLGDASNGPALANFVAAGVLAPAGPAVASAHFRGPRQAPTAIVVGFTGPIPPGSAAEPSRYGVTGRDGHRLKVASAVEDPATGAVTLRLARRLDPRRSYRVAVAGVRGFGVVTD